MTATINASTSGGGGIIQTADSSGILALQTAGVTAVTINGSQNVGIGTSSPNVLGANAENAILTLKGKAATRSGILELGNYGTTGNGQTLGWTRYFDGSTENASIEVARASSTSTAYMAFSTNGGSGNTERARIDSSGRFLIGKTSSIGSSNLQVAVTPGGNTGITTHATTTGTSYAALFYTSDGVDHGYISYSTSGTSYNTTSDYRLKESIAPMTGALAKVAALKPCTYTWKHDGSNGEGFIAHELAEVVPQCVTGEKDEIQTYLDEDGVEQTKPRYQGIDTSFLVATLTAAIQELKAINETQAQAITTLTERITALEGAQA